MPLYRASVVGELYHHLAIIYVRYDHRRCYSRSTSAGDRKGKGPHRSPRGEVTGLHVKATGEGHIGHLDLKVRQIPKVRRSSDHYLQEGIDTSK